ncbi:hypothetical protein AHAS_Ahas20G0183600 [Arachis hypogaea]
MSCISEMSDVSTKKTHIPHLNDALLWKIFVKADPRTVGRCRTLNKEWNGRLSKHLVAKQNWTENQRKASCVIIGVEYPQSNANSQWLTRTDIDCGHQIPLNIPIIINQFGFYSVIGSDHGVLCIRYSQGGMNTGLLILNPLTKDKNYVSDDARKNCCQSVSLYAFGYMHDTMEYCIVHVYKRHVSDKHMGWSLYNSYDNDWMQSGVFETDIKKLGPKCIVDKEIAYWISWDGRNFSEPAVVATFSMLEMVFSEARIPAEVKTTYHSLTHFNDGVGFISYEKAGYSTTIVIWDMKHDGQDQLRWKRMVRVSGVGIPYNPTLFIGKDIISVMGCRTIFGGSNDGKKTNVLLSRLKNNFARREHLMYRSWEEYVWVNTVTLHSESLYLV